MNIETERAFTIGIFCLMIKHLLFSAGVDDINSLSLSGESSALSEAALSGDLLTLDLIVDDLGLNKREIQRVLRSKAVLDKDVIDLLENHLFGDGK